MGDSITDVIDHRWACSLSGDLVTEVIDHPFAHFFGIGNECYPTPKSFIVDDRTWVSSVIERKKTNRFVFFVETSVTGVIDSSIITHWLNSSTLVR